MVPPPASKTLKPAARRRSWSAAGPRKGTGHRRRTVPPLAARTSIEAEGGRWRGEKRSLPLPFPGPSSPRRPDKGTCRKRQDSGAAMAGGLSWPRRSDGLTFCGWLRLSWAGGGSSSRSPRQVSFSRMSPFSGNDCLDSALRDRPVARWQTGPGSFLPCSCPCSCSCSLLGPWKKGIRARARVRAGARQTKMR